ncbi:DUF4003 domain-containing protein [Halobacillus sp. A1]|uniref:DUF4003 family protein n=1 Tax=Halobacillus sp. A1 TaxID=2880262 RepID=UPI0020A6DB00|nr:DUF4003 family protein [Halobacillus sp. A1]MCP3033286.1 DUF4003 domain-containing protein [Halobacillus sp. A1]
MVTEKLEKYIDIFNVMNDEIKWCDKKILMMASSVYVIKERAFNINEFVELSEHIKTNAGMFSPLNSNLRFSVASMLDTRFEQPKEVVQILNAYYDKLVEGGFKRGNFTYIAALAMMTDNVETSHIENKIDRALYIYKSMRQEHPFITTNEDYPLAVLLSEREGAVKDVIARIEYFYKELHTSKFRKGNDLQFLSHILSLSKEEEPEVYIKRSIEVLESLKRASIKPKPIHYPEVGLLSLIEHTDIELENTKQLKLKLDNQRHFKWQRELNFKVAVNLAVSESLKGSSLVETGMLTTMEAIMQAQQTAMITGITAATAVSASNNG